MTLCAALSIAILATISAEVNLANHFEHATFETLIVTVPLKPIHSPYPKNYDPSPSNAILKPLVIHIPIPFAYKESKAVPWEYGVKMPSKKVEAQALADDITNIAGMESGRVYKPQDLWKGQQAEEKKKGKVNEAKERKEVIEDEATKFLKIIYHSEYKLLEEEILTEGKGHNQPLHISVKCGNYMLVKVLINNGSSLNVMPKSTLNKIHSTSSQLRTSDNAIDTLLNY
ncbi:hypothetical protein CR513_37527, partial [Mucuna pruriens]